MSNIKFRAWIIAEKQHFQVIEISFCSKNVRVAVPTYTKDGSDVNWDFKLYTFDEIVLEQWTGLHDKAGTEIYEGDRCTATGWGDVVHEIVFVDGAYGTKTPKCGYINDINLFYPSGGCLLTVIGHVHESEAVQIQDINKIKPLDITLQGKYEVRV